MNLSIKKPPCTYKYIKGIFAFERNYLLSRDKATKNAKRKNKKTVSEAVSLAGYS